MQPPALSKMQISRLSNRSGPFATQLFLNLACLLAVLRVSRLLFFPTRATCAVQSISRLEKEGGKERKIAVLITIPRLWSQMCLYRFDLP